MKTDYPKYRIAAAIRPAFLHMVLFFKLLNRAMPIIGDAVQIALAVFMFMYMMLVTRNENFLKGQWNYDLSIVLLLLLTLQFRTFNRYMDRPKDKLDAADDFIFYFTLTCLMLGLLWAIAGPYSVIGLIAAWLLLMMPIAGLCTLIVILYKWVTGLRQSKEVKP